MLEKQFFKNRFLLCCVSFCLLGKILLVSRIQTDFARLKRSGYARLGKMDFQRPVRAAKKVFGSYPVWKTSLFTKRSLLMLHAFAFRLFFPKRKALADIHRNVGLIRLVMRRSSNCSKPVIIWTLGHLGPGHTTAKTMTTVTVTFTATAKNAVNRSHTQNFLSSHWCPICCELPFHCIFQACSAPQRRTRLGEWSLRPLFSSLLSQ